MNFLKGGDILGAGRKQKPLSNTSKHYTAVEIEAKKEKEKKLNDFVPINKTPPKYLPENAKKEYKRVIKLFGSLPVSQLDQQILIQYCDLVSEYHDISEEIQKIKEELSGGFYIDLDKVLTTKRRQKIDIFKEIKSHASLLGMSIESRMRLVPEESNEEDPFADLFGGDMS
ncbi:phage terminase small subunit P27 family [Macrococcus armenti]|uniref:phage terminase small subunit P27 family n=1 Tax=Macrococcus armenti TaxID=2875764 RepID=UPI001CC9636A|nr:phage terminase small subunit P27 family [Macrococcus armenti]UBH12433.1 phage terminase small subunit P27 family [Macrococcus armenti]